MERASAGQLTRPPRAPAAAAALPSSAPSRTSSGAVPHCARPQVPDPAHAPGSGPAGPGGALYLGTPSDAQRGSSSPADGAAAAAAAARRAPLRPRPVRLSAELAPPPRQLRRPLPRPLGLRA
ncbi:atherin-like [Lutra lutra]|uniref:atherin-like n=1 Tax=Lutra lutra TaxID=9657 RepID=UPI001FD32D2E|nr:atherin-like [Lutra lutra]